MIAKIKQYLKSRKCVKHGHHWFCERTLDNSMICMRFYKWVCLTCAKSEITNMADWDRMKLRNPQDELDKAMPK